jgi:hypothetical protein
MSKHLSSKLNLSKNILGISMMGFFGILSPNTAFADCSQYHDNEESCNSQANCKFLPGGINCRASNDTNPFSNFICAMSTETGCPSNPEGCNWGPHASFCLPFIGKETKK